MKSLNLKEEIINGLSALNITEPTNIQKEVIPRALNKENIIGQSETGTGKTLAYLLPIIQNIDTTKKEMQAIILAPTHELAAQINNVISETKKACSLDITSASIIGSANIKRQIETLKKKPNILVGSAGRILELITKKKISSHTIKTIVIDEVDKLLDKNNLETIQKIIKSCQKQTQLMMFSATLSNKTLDIAKTLGENLEVISAKRNKVNENIIHNYIPSDPRKKIESLRRLINATKPKRVLVFNNDTYVTNTMVENLKFNNIKVAEIGGSNKMEERKKALNDFRNGKIQVLIASDVAARGLDIQDITYVVNYDIPSHSEDYLHRSGRVGRGTDEGTVYSLVDYKEEELLKSHANKFNINITRKIVYKGNVE